MLKPFRNSWSVCVLSWHAIIVDGHSVEELCKAFGQAKHQPTAIIAKTFKGKGISGNKTTIALHTHVGMICTWCCSKGTCTSEQQHAEGLSTSVPLRNITAEKIDLVLSSEMCASYGVLCPWDGINAHSVCQGLPWFPLATAFSSTLWACLSDQININSSSEYLHSFSLSKQAKFIICSDLGKSSVSAREVIWLLVPGAQVRAVRSC